MQIKSNILVYLCRKFEVNINKNDKVKKWMKLRNEKSTATVSWVLKPVKTSL